MILPTDLPREVSERVVQPGFDAVLDRARGARRRRRTTIASGTAAAVVVAGVAVAAGGIVDDGRSPDPADPARTTPWDGTSTPDDRLPADVVSVLDDDRLQLWSISGGDDEAVAALWRGCDADPCRFAVVVRDGDDVHGEALGTTPPTLTSVPGGWLVGDAGGTSLLATSGEQSAVVDTGPGGADDVVAGDAAVPTADGWRLLRGTKLIPVPERSPGFEVSSAYVTPDGGLVVASSAPGGRLEHTTRGVDGTWTSSMDVTETLDADAGTRTMVLAGNGDHVALATLGDDPDGSIPVLGVQVSHDAGRTWVATVNLDTEGGDRVRDMSSLAVGADGTAYLTTGSHHLVRIDDQGFVTPIQLSALDTSVFASGDEVCLVTERGRRDAQLCSPDGITGWYDQPLPGFR